MAKQVLLDVRLFAGAADLSGWSNKIELIDKIEDKDVTNWRSGGAKELIGGLETVEIKASGQWEAGDPGKIDDLMWADKRVVEPVTLTPTGASDLSAGGPVYLTRALRNDGVIGGQVGDVFPWSADWSGSWPLARGVVSNASGVIRTTSGFSGGFNLGALTGSFDLYSTLHILSVAGTTPSLIVTVQSSVDNTFAAPTTRATFSTFTARGGQALMVQGPVTDAWWRVGWTIAGTTPSFQFISAIGIA